LKSVIKYLKEFETQDSLNKNSSEEIVEEAPVGSEVRAKSGLKLSSSLVNSISNDVELKKLISTYTEHVIAKDKTHIPGEDSHSHIYFLFFCYITFPPL
jgi:hypothetical protein